MSSQQPASRWLIAATVSFYISSALVMVMANKWVLKSTPIPLTFLLFQVIIAIILLYLVRFSKHKSLQYSLPAKLDWEVVKGLRYMIALNVAGLTFNTFTLKLVDASFYQVARGLVLPFTVVTSAIFLAARPSRLILAACLIITLGFLIGVAPVPGSGKSWEIRGFTPIGVMFGLASSVSTAFHVVVIKKSFALVNNSPLDLNWYSQCTTAILLLPMALFLEFSKARTFLTTMGSDDLTTFWIGTAITGTGGFLISLAGMLSVKITSPITHMVSSAVRGVAQTALGMWLFGDIITTVKATSVGTILAGSIWYTWVKHVETTAYSAAASSVKARQDPESGSVTTAKDGVTYENVPVFDAEADDEDDFDLEGGRAHTPRKSIGGSDAA